MHVQDAVAVDPNGTATANLVPGRIAVAPGAPSLKRRLPLRSLVGLLVGSALVLLWLRLINLHAALRSAEHLRIGLALLSGLVFLSAYAVRALRWRRFLAPDRIPVHRVVSIYLVAVFLNWALPVQGGELAKSAMLRRTNGIPVSRSLATVSMDKAMDLLPGVALLAAVPFAHLHLSGTLWVILLLASLGFIGIISVLAFATWKRERALSLVDRILNLVLPDRVAGRITPFIAGFVDTMLELVRRPRLMIGASIYTAAAATLDGLFCYLAFHAVGAPISLTVAFYGYTFYNLAYILPTPPGHVGTNEVVGLLVFAGVFGVSRSSVGAMFLFSHPWTALLMTVFGLIGLKAVGLRLPAAMAIRSRTAVEA